MTLRRGRRRFPAGGEDTGTVLVGAPARGGDTATHRVRPVLSEAGHERTDRPCPTGRIAGGWELDVIAPDGAVLVTPGGTLFVRQPSTPGGGRWCSEPGTAPRPPCGRQP